MSRELYRYSFPPHVPIEEVEATLLLAIWGTESLHGEAQVRLDAAHLLDGFLGREFGPESFRVERLVELGTSRQAKEVPA
jgi:hypothetical protein